MRTADKQIADILVRYGEPFGGNVWRVQGTAVIYHKTLERIATQAQIRFDPPQVLRAERDECVMIVTGRCGDRLEWSAGEALVNVNYRVSGKQAAYVYAMAEKRGKDRVILKLIDLHGLIYSEEEADEFRAGQPAAIKPAEDENDEDGASDADLDTSNDLKQKINEATTINAVTDLMLAAETQAALTSLPQAMRDALRDHAKSRLVSLGWPKRRSVG